MDSVMQGILIGVGTAAIIDLGARIWQFIKKRTDRLKKFYSDGQTRELKGIIKDVIVENKLVSKDELQPLMDNQKDLKKEVKQITETTKEIQNDLQTVEDANLATLKNNLLHSFDFCSNRGYTTPEDVDTWFKMYDSYLKLHGNSFMEAMAEDFRQIPVRTRLKNYMEDSHKNLK